MNRSIMYEEEDASTAAGKTEKETEQIQVKIGRMTITTPAGWGRQSLDGSAQK